VTRPGAGDDLLELDPRVSRDAERLSDEERPIDERVRRGEQRDIDAIGR
jgi:hypothetical protein